MGYFGGFGALLDASEGVDGLDVKVCDWAVLFEGYFGFLTDFFGVWCAVFSGFVSRGSVFDGHGYFGWRGVLIGRPSAWLD